MLSGQERRQLGELADELSDVRRSIHSTSVMARFNQLLGTEFSASWRFARNNDQFSLTDVTRSNAIVEA